MRRSVAWGRFACAGFTVVLVVSGCSTQTSLNTLSAHPATLTVNGTTLYREGARDEAEGAILDPGNAYRLWVLLPEAAPTAVPDPGQCPSLVGPFAYVEKETASSVVLGVGAYGPKTVTPRSGAGTYTLCHTTFGKFRRLPVTLSAPLGSRHLGSHGSGSAPVLIEDRSVPTPTYVPAGYRSAGLDATFDLQAERRYRHGTQELDIIAGEPPLIRPLQPTPGAAVNGHPAQVFDTQQSRTVTWFVTARRSVTVTTRSTLENPGRPTTDDLPTLSVATLLRVARSC